jgi:hypothetical protein
MAHTTASAYATREAILELLSDAEVAKVSNAEGAAKMEEGQHFVDLENLNLGVQKASVSTTPSMGNIVTRSAVSDTTWAKVSAAVSA